MRLYCFLLIFSIRKKPSTQAFISGSKFRHMSAALTHGIFTANFHWDHMQVTNPNDLYEIIPPTV